MRFRLRTLLIVLALGPPVLAGAWTFGAKAVAEYRARQSVVIWEDVGGPGAVVIYDGTLCTLTISDAESAADEIDE